MRRLIGAIYLLLASAWWRVRGRKLNKLGPPDSGDCCPYDPTLDCLFAADGVCLDGIMDPTNCDYLRRRRP